MNRTAAVDAARSRPELAILISSFDCGGVERMMVNLARGLAAAGVPVDFLVRSTDLPYLDALPDEVTLITLGEARDSRLVQAVADYLGRTRPAAVLTSKPEDDALAQAARGRSRAPTRHAVRIPTHLTGRLAARGVNPLRRWQIRRRIRRICRAADVLIAVSEAVAEDVARMAGLPRERVRAIRNPTITPELEARAAERPAHPWLTAHDRPVIVGAGGLRRQKDFETLLRAFALVRARRRVRLLILGEGRRRTRLERLAARLDLTDDVALPGFIENPYPCLQQADLFVLSSLWEGSPNVLTEALALGTPVVSTDCPSGPREILAEGRYGTLVPPGDAEALARAMLETLEHPLPPETLRGAVAGYTIDVSARRYMDALGLVPAHDEDIPDTRSI